MIFGVQILPFYGIKNGKITIHNKLSNIFQIFPIFCTTYFSVTTLHISPTIKKQLFQLSFYNYVSLLQFWSKYVIVIIVLRKICDFTLIFGQNMWVFFTQTTFKLFSQKLPFYVKKKKIMLLHISPSPNDSK